MNSNTIEYVDFCSQVTKTTITLPANWQRAEVEADVPTDVYFLTSDYDYDPQIIVRIIEIPEDERHALNYQELAEALMLEQSKNSALNLLEVIEQKIVMIDDHPARIDVFHHLDREMKTLITQYQACIQGDSNPCGFLAMVEAEYLEKYLPIFEAAVQSICFHS